MTEVVEMGRKTYWSLFKTGIWIRFPSAYFGFNQPLQLDIDSFKIQMISTIFSQSITAG
jgi:hypothetical protein